MSEQKKSKTWIYVLIVLGIAVLSLLSSSMINITVLDPQPFTNLTLMVNLT